MTLENSPLFEPVLWQEDGFKILDEILLPGRIEYIEVKDVGHAVDAVQKMKTRAFGQVLTFLYSSALLAKSYQGKEAKPLEAELARMTQRFCAARPTFDFKGLGEYFAQWLGDLPNGADAGAWVVARARETGARLTAARQARAKRAAAALPERGRFLTHCNISGELVAVARHCRTMGKDISVIATETRPYLQGTRLTAWELAQAGVAVSVIPDCAIAQVMANGDVQAVIVGSDRCARNGDIINKVGTYPLALMAREYKLPFYALVQYPGRLERGADVEIEERPPHELLEFQGRSLLVGGSDEVGARYPAFDLTPADLITGLIGFEDLLTPASFREKHQGRQAKSIDCRQRGGKYCLIYGIPQAGSYEDLSRALKTSGAESFLIPEMRPQLWGARVVAPELLKQKAAVTLISDNMMGALFAQGEVSRLCLCCDDISDQGLTGITGSLLAVHLARAHRVPVVLLQGDRELHAPVDRDVSTFLGQSVISSGVSIHPLRSETLPRSVVMECQGVSS